METQVRCSKADCPVASGGGCSEGYDPIQSCPYYGRTADDDVDEGVAGFEDRERASSVDDDVVPLASGEALDGLEVDVFLRWRPATFVTIVGDRDSGKTTLVAAFYDRFLRGPFADHIFAGSRTLVGLEKRSHYARADSGRAKPDTPRTSISEGLSYFHFAVRSVALPAPRTDLMLTDRAGETYRQARSNSELVPQLTELSQADRVVLLLDGARIADAVTRAGAMQAVRQSLRAFLDGGGLRHESVVQVVTTKIDLLERHPEQAAIRDQLTAFKDRLVQSFAPRLASLTFWDIAARDPDGLYPPAYGVEPLFRNWLTPYEVTVAPAVLPGTLLSEFDKLLLRTPLETLP
ncbi:TRAFAC clade GTPase domain-containing protein [Methylobacterium iners]|uniref:TRAFAC clade GTPase domain-containing protein n=1 Tax=Methylobacterium iners TaxID=418707 RepID=UPI001EE27114|nr:hypothetical protein [Methylobacterium iners]